MSRLWALDSGAFWLTPFFLQCTAVLQCYSSRLVSSEPRVQGPEPKAKDALLSRELGVRQLAAVIFNYTVGSGIFVLPAVVAAQLGARAILAYLACAFIMALMTAAPPGP